MDHYQDVYGITKEQYDAIRGAVEKLDLAPVTKDTVRISIFMQLAVLQDKVDKERESYEDS